MVLSWGSGRTRGAAARAPRRRIRPIAHSISASCACENPLAEWDGTSGSAGWSDEGRRGDEDSEGRVGDAMSERGLAGLGTCRWGARGQGRGHRAHLPGVGLVRAPSTAPRCVPVVRWWAGAGTWPWLSRTCARSWMAGCVPGQGVCNRLATGGGDGSAMAGATGDRATRRGRGRRLLAMVAGGAAGAPVETWTVLFTDQVGSTAMRVRVGEEAFDGIRADLDARRGGCARGARCRRDQVDRRRRHGRVHQHGGRPAMRGGDPAGGGGAEPHRERGRRRGRGRWRCASGSASATPSSRTVTCRGPRSSRPLGCARRRRAGRSCARRRSGSCRPTARAARSARRRPVDLKGLPGPVQAHEVSWEPLPYDPREHRLAFRVLGPLEVLDGDRPVGVGGAQGTSSCSRCCWLG